MKTKLLTLATLVFAYLVLAILPATAQPITLTGTNYFQDFNNLTTDAALPAGWTVLDGFVMPTSLGNVAPFPGTQGSWSATTGAFYNVASTSNNGVNFTGTESTNIQATATNRAPAVRVSAAFGDTNNTSKGGVAFAMEIANTTGLGNFKIDLDFLLLSPMGRSNIWTVDYGFGASPTSFLPIGSYLANNTNGGGVFGATHMSLSFGSALDNNPGPVWIRVADETVITPPNLLSGGSGSRPMVGIDNVSLSYTAVANTTNPVVITQEPATNVNVNAASSASLTVGVSGTAPNYQWYQIQNGVTNLLNDGSSPSGDGSTITGSTGPSLIIGNAFGGEDGQYFAVITNAVSTTNTTIANLTINDPFISAEPQNRTNVLNDLDDFTGTATGTQPIELTWYYNGAVISDTTLSSGTFADTSEIFVPNTVSNAIPPGYYLVASNSLGTSTSAVVTATIPLSPSVLLTRWDFDQGGLSPVSPTASVGMGVGAEAPGDSLITNYFFANGTLADPISAGNEGWELEDFATQGTSNKLIGFQFNTSTVGYHHIFMAWQERHSATASKYMRVQYTTNGTDFVDANVLTATQVAYNFFSSDLTGITGVDNNPNFGFRIVAELESTAINDANNVYDATSVGSTYGPGPSGGTVRLDLMNVFADPLSTLPTLNLQSSGGTLTLSWSGAFDLQSATDVNGPYITIPNAPNPFVTNGLAGGQQFFRLKSQ